MADPDLSDKRGRAGKRGIIRDPEIRRGRSQKIFLALWASVWSKNKGGPTPGPLGSRAPRGPPLDPPLRCFRIRLVSSVFSSDIYWNKIVLNQWEQNFIA